IKFADICTVRSCGNRPGITLVFAIANSPISQPSDLYSFACLGLMSASPSLAFFIPTRSRGPIPASPSQMPTAWLNTLAAIRLRHALLAEHLLEHVTELRVLGLRARIAALSREDVPCPAVRAAAAAAARRSLLLGRCASCVGVLVPGEGVAAAGEAEEAPLGV